jgi:putative ABC transport system permease protein
VFNLKASMDIAIGQTLGYILTDVNIGFNQAYRMDKLEPIARSIPGVTHVEGWGQIIGEVLTADGTTSTQVLMYAPPADSTLIKPTLTSGRWLLPEDENAVVIGNHMQKARPELKVGDTITFSYEGKESDWVIVGTYKMAGNVIPPILYVNYEHFMSSIGLVGRVFSIQVVTDQHDLASQTRIGKQLEAAFIAAGVQVSSMQTGAERIAANKMTTDILVYFMLVMAVLIAIVGGLGLMSTMSINVIERTREIGVMRAIGASNRSIQSIVIVEGMLIGILSWIIGAILAVPIGSGLASVVGVAFLQSPLDFTFALDGFSVWLVMVVVIAAVASYVPARNASRLTVREVLAYE